jgi:uncharacterized protein YbjT (DUF2867 family)
VITITTPTGHIGRRLVELLVTARRAVTIIARHPEKLSPWLRAREVVRQASSEDAAAVARATEGTDVLFWLTPLDVSAPNVRAWYRKIADSLRYAVRRNHIPRVVNLSSIGADQADGLEAISGLHDVEQAANDAADNVLHLRPGFFMENFLSQLDSIRRDRKLYWLYPGQARLPMIATTDIAQAAAEKLIDDSWSGHLVQGLHGPTDLSFEQATKILGAVTGKVLQHVQLTPDEFRWMSRRWGMSEDLTENYVEMLETYNRLGWAWLGEPRTPGTTTRTSLGAWASQNLIPLLQPA